MAAKNLNEEEMMFRLSNHVNGISLILDIVNVNTLHQGSELQKVIARQLLALRARISNMPTVGTGTNGGTSAAKNAATNADTNASQDARPSPATQVPGPQHPDPKGPVKVTPPVPQQLSLTEEGWRILNNEREAQNFAVDSYKTFHCLVCRQSMHTNNLLGHIRGKTHIKKNSAQEKPMVEEEEEEEEEGGHYGGHYGGDDGGYYGREYDGRYGGEYEGRYREDYTEDYSEDNFEDYHRDYRREYRGGEYNNSDYVDNLIREMENSSHERRVDLMWNVVNAIERTTANIEPSGKRFYCRICQKTLNGPLPVVDHVRGSAYHNAYRSQ